MSELLWSAPNCGSTSPLCCGLSLRFDGTNRKAATGFDLLRLKKFCGSDWAAQLSMIHFLVFTFNANHLGFGGHIERHMALGADEPVSPVIVVQA